MTKTLQNLEEGPLNTDDRTVIEFGFARSVGTPKGFQIANLLNSAHAAQCDRPPINESLVDWKHVERTRNPPSQPNGGTITSLPELEPLALNLATKGDPAAAALIDQLAAFVPSDAEAIRAVLNWKQGKAKEAAEALVRFFQAAHENPWPDPGLTNNSVALAEEIARSGTSPDITASLYDVLNTPLCLWNSDFIRELRIVSIATAADGNHPGERTVRALNALEPNIVWERKFLETRKDAYAAGNDPRAAQAAHDWDEFLQHEALTSDAAALTKEFEKNGGSAPR